MAHDLPANRVIAISSNSNDPTDNLVLAQPSIWLHAAADSTANVQGHLCFKIACMHAHIAILMIAYEYLFIYWFNCPIVME